MLKISVLYKNKLFAGLFGSVGILLTCGKHHFTKRGGICPYS